MHTEAHFFSVPNDCLWYDKLWGPSQRVVTLLIKMLMKSLKVRRVFRVLRAIIVLKVVTAMNICVFKESLEDLKDLVGRDGQSSTLVTNSLTHSCLVDLIDMTLADEDGYLLLVRGLTRAILMGHYGEISNA